MMFMLDVVLVLCTQRLDIERILVTSGDWISYCQASMASARSTDGPIFLFSSFSLIHGGEIVNLSEKKKLNKNRNSR